MKISSFQRDIRGIIFLLGISSGTFSLNANVIQNPGFENGMNHWEITTGSGDLMTDTMGVRNGNYSLLLHSEGIDGFRQTGIPVESNTWYRLTVHSKVKHDLDWSVICYYMYFWTKIYVNGEEIYWAHHNWYSSRWLQEDWTIFNTEANTLIDITIEKDAFDFPPGTEGIVYDDIILAPYDTIRPVLLTAEASDGNNPVPGIDDDDYVTLAFSEPTNKIPVQRAFDTHREIIHPIDIVFKLSNGHTWLNGNGEILKAVWNATGDTLIVYLSTDGGVPSIEVGDTIRPGRCKILDESGNPILRDIVVLTGTFDPIAVEEAGISSKPFELFQNTPNPFVERTSICFQVPEERMKDVSLKIYDVTGKLVRKWDYHTMGQSDHIIWDGTDEFQRKTSAGIYFYTLETRDKSIMRKMILLRGQ